MHYKTITRVNPKTGALERPWRNRDHQFVLGDPSKGDQRHHDEHAVKVDNYGEAVELVQGGFAIRVSDGRSPPSLVVPGSLEIGDDPVTSLDDYWTYTMPEVPFTQAELEQDIRSAILCHAGEISWMAGQDAADGFIGFSLGVDVIEHGEQAELIDLERFNLTRLARNAYESAFRVGKARLIGDKDIDEIELLLGAMLSKTGHRYPHPIDSKTSPLRRTLASAYLRWKIYETRLVEDHLDQSGVENLAVLAGMSEQAVRNSLAKEGLSAVRGKADYLALIKWLEGRRDFVPLREDERLEARATWARLARLKRKNVASALKFDSSVWDGDSAHLSAVNELADRIASLSKQDQPVPDADLRAYARSAQLCIDTFVTEFRRALTR